MKKNNKNKVYIPNLILVIIGIGVILFSSYNIISLGLLKNTKPTVLNTLENKYYIVGKDPTAYQKDTFKLLTAALSEPEVNYEEVSELVGKSFVIDFFGWSNKDSSFDIGGLQYMRDPATFSKVAHWEYYQKVDVFSSTYGDNKLPMVKDIKATVNKIEDYQINDRTYNTYEVDLNWDYDNKTNLDSNEFVSSVNLIMIEDAGKVTIVEVKMIDEVNEDE